jgi:hypothetical protein
VNQSWLQRRWPAIRARGFWRYVLVRGVLAWGGGMSLVIAAMLAISARRQELHLQSIWPLVPLFCLPAGAFWALISWHWNDYLYRKLGFDKSDHTQ